MSPRKRKTLGVALATPLFCVTGYQIIQWGYDILLWMNELHQKF